MSTNNVNNNNLNPTSSSGVQPFVTTAQSSPSVTTSSTVSHAQLPAVSSSANDGGRSFRPSVSVTSSRNAIVDTSTSQRLSCLTTSATTTHSSQKNRKLVSRPRTETDDSQNKTSSSSSSSVASTHGVGTPQHPSANPPSNKTYVIRDNEGRWFLLQAASTAANVVHQPTLQHQVQSHQVQSVPAQVVKSSMINGNATLGQLARSLAPKPTNLATTVTTVSRSLSNVGLTQAGSLRPGLLHSTQSVSSSPSQAVMSHYQAIRPATSANPQLLTMISGYYLQPTSSLPSHTALVNQAKIATPVAQLSNGSNLGSGVQPQIRFQPLTSVSPSLKQSHLHKRVTQATEKLPAVDSSKTAPQIMYMPSGTVAQAAGMNATALPIVCSGTEAVRQHKFLGSSLSGQLLPVLHQQQNLPQSEATSASSPPSSFARVHRRMVGDLEPGTENEPPSIECHGETREAYKVRFLFLREAQAFNEKIGFQREIVHSVDGLEILESDKPFPSVPPVPLEEWMPRGPREANRDCESTLASDEQLSNSSQIEGETEFDKCSEPNFLRTDIVKTPGNHEHPTNFRKASSKSSTSGDNSPNKSSDSNKKRKRKSTEVDRLLQMDFGPNQVWVKDTRENSVKNFDKERSGEVKCISNEENSEVSSSSRRKSSEKRRSSVDKKGEEKPVSNGAAAKEKKRKERGSSKRGGRESDESPSEVINKDPIRAGVGQQLTSAKSLQEVDNSTLNENRKMSAENAAEPSGADRLETPLNSSLESAGDLGAGIGNISLSDEDLDTERCIYCDGYLRVKRLINHPQYCSKKCRKLWKKNPVLSGARHTDSPVPQQQCGVSGVNTSPSSSNVVPDLGGHLITSPNLLAPVQSQQRPPRTIILKMGAMSKPEISSTVFQSQTEVTAIDAHHVLSRPATKAFRPSTSPFVQTLRNSEVHVPTTRASHSSVHVPLPYSPVAVGHISAKIAEPKEKADVSGGHPRTWTCDEVALWVAKVTGTDEIGDKFRSQDVDGQSLLLMAESEGGIAALLTQKLLLKLGPVLKLERALKDLIARNQ